MPKFIMGQPSVKERLDLAALEVKLAEVTRQRDQLKARMEKLADEYERYGSSDTLGRVVADDIREALKECQP